MQRLSGLILGGWGRINQKNRWDTFLILQESMPSDSCGIIQRINEKVGQRIWLFP